MNALKRIPSCAARLVLMMPLLMTWRMLVEANSVTIFNPADFNRRYEDFIAAAPNSPNAEVIWILSANIQLTPATNGLADEFKETVHIADGHNLHIRQLSGVRTLTRNYGENATFMVHDQGSLTIDNIIITTTATSDGSAIYVGTGGKLRLDGTTFLNCFTAYGSGGAVFSDRGSLNVTAATFTACSAPQGNGGALASVGGFLELRSSSFNRCKARSGGALSVDGNATTTLGATTTTTTVSGNVTTAATTTATKRNAGVTLRECTFQEQNASSFGGDVFVGGDAVVDMDKLEFGAPGVTSTAAVGGCVHLAGNSALTVRGSVLQGCGAQLVGGAFAVVDEATLALVSSRVLDASAGGLAGGTGGGRQQAEAEWAAAAVNAAIAAIAAAAKGSGGLGGALYVGGKAKVSGVRLVLKNTDAGSQALVNVGGQLRPGRCQGGVGSGCGRSVWRGGGLYAEGAAQVALEDLTCESLDASGGGACLFATQGASVSVVGAKVNSTTNSSRALAFVDLDNSGGAVILTDIAFASNRRGSLLASGSSVTVLLTNASFQGDAAASPEPHGGSVRVDRGATFKAKKVTAEGNAAGGGDGGWLYGSASTVELEDLVANDNTATGKGGAVFGDSMYSLKLARAFLTGNSAKQGGALYCKSCNKHAQFEDPALFFGVQLFDSALKSNVARLGGAVSGEDSFLYARDTEFLDNVNVGFNARGSAVAFAPDAVFERCLFKNPEMDGNVYERSGNESMVEGERVVMDSSAFNVTNNVGKQSGSNSGSVSSGSSVSGSLSGSSEGVIAIRLNNGTEGRGISDDSVYTLLSRNTDLSGLRIVGKPKRPDSGGGDNGGEGGGNGKFGSAAYQAGQSEGESWDWPRCDNDADGASQSVYQLQASVADKNSEAFMPQLWSRYSLRYAPICPPDADCVDDPVKRTISCTCPSGGLSAFESVNNALHSCQTLAPTPAPTFLPTEVAFTTAKPTPSPKVLLTNFTMALENPYLSVDAFDLESMPAAIKPVAYAFFGLASAVLLLSLLVNAFKFTGMTGRERQGWVLGTMYNFPKTFQYMLLVDREDYVGELMHAEEREEERELARKMTKRSMSQNYGQSGGVSGQGVGDLFRGASYDRSFDGGSLFRGASYDSFGPGHRGGSSLARGQSFDSVGGRGASYRGGNSFDGVQESKFADGGDLQGGGVGMASASTPGRAVLERSQQNPMGGALTAAL